MLITLSVLKPGRILIIVCLHVFNLSLRFSDGDKTQNIFTHFCHKVSCLYPVASVQLAQHNQAFLSGLFSRPLSLVSPSPFQRFNHSEVSLWKPIHCFHAWCACQPTLFCSLLALKAFATTRLLTQLTSHRTSTPSTQTSTSVDLMATVISGMKIVTFLVLRKYSCGAIKTATGPTDISARSKHSGFLAKHKIFKQILELMFAHPLCNLSSSPKKNIIHTSLCLSAGTGPTTPAVSGPAGSTPTSPSQPTGPPATGTATYPRGGTGTQPVSGPATSPQTPHSGPTVPRTSPTPSDGTTGSTPQSPSEKCPWKHI